MSKELTRKQLLTLARTIEELPDSTWDKFSVGTKRWCGQAVTALNANKPVDPLPLAVQTELKRFGVSTKGIPRRKVGRPGGVIIKLMEILVTDRSLTPADLYRKAQEKGLSCSAASANTACVYFKCAVKVLTEQGLLSEKSDEDK